MEGRDEAGRARIVSVDAFRGLTILALFVVDHPFIEEAMPAWAHHAEWHGVTAADWVFPSYMLLVGVAMGLSGRRPGGWGWKPVLRFLVRVAVLVALGLLVNYLKVGLPLRYPGVLQRIALASLLAWPFRGLKAPLALGVAAVMLAAHAYVLTSVPLLGATAGDLTPEGNVARAVDLELLGEDHVYRRRPTDPEGLLGTLAAAGQVMLGVALAGLLTARRRGLALALAALAAVALLVGGLAGAEWLPLNKRLWTSTFVLVTSGGLSLGLLALFALSDAVGRTRWLSPFVPLGRNALLVYAGSSISFTLLAHAESAPLERAAAALVPRAGELGATLAITGVEVALWWTLAAVLHWRRVYVRL